MVDLSSCANVRVVVARLRNWQTVVPLFFFFLSPALALAVGIDKPLNLVALGIMSLLFFGCVLLVPADELPAFYRLTVWVFLFGFLLNTGYELVHSVFYTHFTEPGYTYFELVLMLIGAAVADGFISLNLLFAATVFRRGKWKWTPPWDWKSILFVVTLALGGQIVGEVVALGTGEWAYNAAMPLILAWDVGLTPALQMPLLILPTFWLAHRVAHPRGRGGNLDISPDCRC
jgi:hypothetical protein